MVITQTGFVALARALQQEAARLGLVVPAFRAPTHQPGALRTLRRCPGQMVVCVTLGREEHDVAHDMIEGCLKAQPGVEPEGVEVIRDALWMAAGLAGLAPAARF